jgi:hypothetical protein
MVGRYYNRARRAKMKLFIYTVEVRVEEGSLLNPPFELPAFFTVFFLSFFLIAHCSLLIAHYPKPPPPPETRNLTPCPSLLIFNCYLFIEKKGVPMYVKTNRLIASYFIVGTVTAVVAGCIVANIANTRKSELIGEYNARFAEQQQSAGSTIAGLEDQLGREGENVARERERVTRERENVERARGIIAKLAESIQRNVRNLSDAIALISEIRTQLEVLEAFLADWYPGGGGA